MKRILMIATGGTIASRRTSTGLAPLITSREVLQYVPEVQSFCAVESEESIYAEPLSRYQFASATFTILG